MQNARRKLWLAGFAALLMTALIALAVAPSAAHAATVKNQQFGLGTSDTTFTSKAYDLNGDKKADTLKVTLVNGSYEGMYKAARVYVNGKLQATIKLSGNQDFFYFQGKVMTMKDGRTFLWAHPSENNDDGPSYVYTWKNGKFVRVADLTSVAAKIAGHNYAVPTAVGNTLAVDLSFMSNATGGLAAKYTYKYKDGKLKRTSTVGTFASYSASGKPGAVVMHANKKLTVYKTQACTSQAFTVNSGQEVTASKIYINGKKCAIKIKASGKTGWVKVGTKYGGEQNKLFKETYYAG